MAGRSLSGITIAGRGALPSRNVVDVDAFWGECAFVYNGDEDRALANSLDPAVGQAARRNVARVKAAAGAKEQAAMWPRVPLVARCFTADASDRLQNFADDLKGEFGGPYPL